MKKYLLLLCNICLMLQINSPAFSQGFSSNLPIAVIDTYGQYIDTAYTTFIVKLGIIYNGIGNRNYLTDPFNNYNGEAKIKLRGSSSLWLPKKTYNISPVDAMEEEVETSLLGMPPADDWVMNAPYQDKTLLRDQIACVIFTQMGHYSSRSRFFELFIDGNYKGVYEMQEKVKRNQYRVDIAKLKDTDVSGDPLTGGYIIALDKYLPGEQGWYSNYYSNVTQDSSNYFLYYYPKADSMPVVQKEYIKNYFHHFENILNSTNYADPVTGYSKYLNVASFIDNFILNEVSRNVDGYRSSTFFYKEQDSKGDGKLHAGPVWDYDIAWGNCYYNGGDNPIGWQYQVFPYNNYVPFWWWQVMSDASFKNQLKCRYEYLRGNILSYGSLYSHIDSMAIFLDESQIRNFTKWPILGTVVPPNPTPVPTSYAGEITDLKNWLQQRLTWLDLNMPGVCNIGIQQNELTENSLHSFPNPFINSFNIMYNISEKATVKVELLNTLGNRIMLLSEADKLGGMHKEEFTVPELSAGIYIIKLSFNNREYYQKLVKLKDQ